MSLLYRSVCNITAFGYYVMMLGKHNLEMVEYVQKYFGEFFENLFLSYKGYKSKVQNIGRVF
jgi:hypothetical protein